MDEKFGDLEVGDEFEVYGDVHLNYNFAKICKCIKDDENSAHEVGGINFMMDKRDTVFVPKTKDVK